MIPDLSALPGGDLVMQGLRDLEAGAVSTPCALLVQIGRPRLAAAGLAIPPSGGDEAGAEVRLYERLCRDVVPDPFGTYNSLVRRLVSCEAALEQQVWAAAERGRHATP